MAKFSSRKAPTTPKKVFKMCKLTELFCLVDDFSQAFLPYFERYLLSHSTKQRHKPCRMSRSEIMTVMIHFHQSGHRNFKNYYTKMHYYLKPFFPQMLSYNRFVELMKSVTFPLIFFILSREKSETGIYFVDSTVLKVCHIKREHSHKVFDGIATKGKSSMGWFFGFKLHIVINDMGEIMAFMLTPANTDDREPVPQLTHNLFGQLIGDKGYISQKLFDELMQKGLKLITKIKKNMKEKIYANNEKLLLRKRAVVESVIDQLKNISQIEHSRHRSPWNFIINLLAGLSAYTLQEKKPSIRSHGSAGIDLIAI